MGKFFKYLIGIVIILFIVFLILWNMFPSLVSSKLSKMAKVDVSISSIRFTTDSVSVNKISVGNPPGSILKKALTVQRTFVSVPLSRFFDKEIVINQMNLDKVYLGLEFDSKKSSTGNWTTIMGNLNSSVSKDKETAAKKGEEKSVFIKRLILTDVNIDLVYRDTREKRSLQPIKRIELTNISSTGGIPTGQIMNIVMQEVLRNIFSKEGLQNMLKDILSPQGKGDFLDKLKGLFLETEQMQPDEEMQDTA